MAEPTIQDRALNWLTGRDTGMSSEALLLFFLGRANDASHPHDNGDFGRCYRMLQLFPEWRARIGDAATLSHSWAALAPAWSELESLYEKDPQSRQLYDKMRSLLRSAERSDGWVSIGKHASIKVSGVPAEGKA